MLELQNISFHADDKDILKDISLKIDDKFVAITGPNGSGKSTLLKVIMGIITPTSGRIIFDGQDIIGLIADRRWFKIRTQYFNMTEFFNAKNLTYQYFLNDTRMCRFSLFANACVLALDNPDTISLSGTTTVEEDSTTTLTATTYPVSASVTWNSSDTTIATVASGVVTGVKAGKATITAVNGNASASVEVTVTAKASD